ncbi:hypothetical protein WUBG_18238 [Wuchereria bancrofti]|uniref:Uncharacterized protein n=1 Tax=Wuchereria bancrofti TaxID=6293 RepID=J9E671_WUCBA|nr:hypothetical protein WUBG_18238 [Wuchereria bancrofti]
MTTEIAMDEVVAKVETSPKKSLSSSVAMKIDSAKRRKSINRRSSSAEKFIFKEADDGTKLKLAEETSLPPVSKTDKEVEVELLFRQKEYLENIDHIFPVKVVEEFALTVQATTTSRRKKMEKARKDLKEEKMNELEKIETQTMKENENQEAYERARKKRIGFIQAVYVTINKLLRQLHLKVISILLIYI